MTTATLPGATASLGWQRGLSYGALGFPLAFAALPLYVHLPHFYVGHVGLSLAAVGAVLLLARLGDALIDPWLGLWSDREARRRGGDRRVVLRWALLPLVAGLLLLLLPPLALQGRTLALVWLILALIITYLGYSLATINYHAWGAEIGDNAAQRTAVTAWREGCALLGVIVAAALPAVPALADRGNSAAMQGLAAVFVLAVVLAGSLTLRRAPTLIPVVPSPGAASPHSVVAAIPASPATDSALRQVGQLLRRDGAFVRLLVVLAVSGIAASVPATLVPFFINDVLGQPERQGLFLSAYFIAAALCLPLWVALARRLGQVAAWAGSMVLATASFVWACTLGPGDGTAFLVICLITGAALGAELALPPALLANLLRRRESAQGAGGLYFGLWNFVTKLNLALAAGIALPLLALLGYQAVAMGELADAENRQLLAVVYALLPAGFKVLALILLWRWRHHFGESDERTRTTND